MINSISGFIAPHATAPRPGQAESTSSADFESVLKSVVSDAAGAVGAAESLALQGMNGSASVAQVVNSVMSAEQSLQIAISIRDKVVAAYGEISRMNI
jgi:flagellar hook-basal body complex protein FliE